MADEPNFELINDKWQNILPQYESDRFDLAIVDPPYRDHNDPDQWLRAKKGDMRDWEPAPKQPYFTELKRVSKNQIIWGGNYFTNFLSPNNNWVIWHKLNDGVHFSMAEMAWCSIRKNTKVLTRRNNTGNKIHPNQKPVALYRWLLSKYANPGDTILDTHLGSGSSAIAAWQKKHDFTGIECDTDYFNDMLHRFNMNTNREYALEAWQKQSEKNGQQTIFSN